MDPMFDGAGHIFFYALVAILPVANPVGLSAPFYALTRHLDNAQRKVVARRVAIYFFVLVLGTVILGRLVLEAFNLSVGVIDIAGGLVLFHAAWVMLQGGEHHIDAPKENQSPDDIAFFPLTMPLTADAAVLAIAVSIGGSVKNHWNFHTVAEYGGITSAIFVVSLTIALCYSSTHFTVAKLGKTGLTAFTSISAFLLMGVGIELIVTGVTAIIENH